MRHGGALVGTESVESYLLNCVDVRRSWLSVDPMCGRGNISEMQLVKYVLCLVCGMLSVLAVFIINEKTLSMGSSETGIARTPATLYDANGILQVQRDQSLVNYELSSPYSQLNVVEGGADMRGEDSAPDAWYVSILNKSNVPEGDRELGIRAIYEDTDGDHEADDLMILAGAPPYQRIVRLNNTVAESEHLRTDFSISVEGGMFVIYNDWDQDGVVDLFTESQDKAIVAQWIIWEHAMYKVTERVDKEKRIFKISKAPGSEELIRWSDTGWEMAVDK